MRPGTGGDRVSDLLGRMTLAEKVGQMDQIEVNSRLHIPLIFGVDAVHGFGHPFRCATVSASRA